MRLPDIGRWVRREPRGPQVTREEALGATPVRNPLITWEVQDSGRVLLTVPLEPKPWTRLLGYLIKVPPQRQVELDEIGSDVWQWCDGERTVRELVGELAKAHKLNRREAEVSMTQFLQTLVGRRFVGLRLELDESRQEALREEMAKPGRTGQRKRQGRQG